MIRAVLDSNVLISGLISASGAPGQVLAAYCSELFELIISSDLLEELKDVLLRPRIRRAIRASQGEVADFIVLLESSAFIVMPDFKLDLSRDPEDNHVLEAAISGRADCIVSGDQDLLVLQECQRIPILTPRAFLALLQEHS